MGFEEWYRNAVERFRRDGVRTGVRGSTQELWQGGLGLLGGYVNYGTSVWDRDWDVLLVLDTCRPDVLAEVAPEYDFLTGYDPDDDVLDSVGSRSPEWIRKTFDPERYAEEAAETAYVSANPHTRDIPDATELGVLDEVWTYAWDETYGTVPPENVMDRAVSVGREVDPERLIVHFMQPHSPYRSLVEEHPDWFTLPVGLDNPEERAEMIIWERLRTGRIDRETHWEAYRDNLRWVLDDGVGPLLENLDAERVVVTSDHGEAFGEWGLYGHSSTAPVPVLKRVPWAETSARDAGEYEPSIEPEGVTLDRTDVDERLAALGYR